MTHMLTVLWDLDGCLINSRQVIETAFKAAFAEVGYSVSKRNLAADIGRPLQAVLSDVVDDASPELAERFVGVFRSVYDSCAHKVVPFDGIVDLLQDLDDHNVEQAVVTAKPWGLVLSSLKAARIDRFFRSRGKGLGSRRYFGGRYDEERTNKVYTVSMALKVLGISKADINRGQARVVMVGDRASDIVAAKENSVTAVGSLWGYGTKEELEGAGADYLCNNVAELRRFLFQESGNPSLTHAHSYPEPVKRVAAG